MVAELAALAKYLREEQAHGAQLGLTDEELAFCDAIRANDRAVAELGDDTLRQIAHELVAIVRRDAKTDWAVNEQVRAKLRATIRRPLLRHGYPPDQEQQATILVMKQAEVIRGDWRREWCRYDAGAGPSPWARPLTGGPVGAEPAPLGRVAGPHSLGPHRAAPR